MSCKTWIHVHFGTNKCNRAFESIIMEIETFQRLLLVRSGCLETVFEVYTGKIKI